uniref:TF-B3 domain-containing protein n=1 Tax=Brassica oleracea var. oleracea TaxID=109376 RepID=A0A0D3ASD4_BRAOL
KSSVPFEICLFSSHSLSVPYLFYPQEILSSPCHSLSLIPSDRVPLAMASTDSLPRFFKVFISHFSSDSMLIPISYYDELPRHLPKTVILQGTGGCLWKVAMRLKQEEEEVYLEQGWPKFVKDNALVDGDFMTFVYNGDNIFEVSIYGLDGCKQARAMAEEEEEGKDSICALSSDDTEDTNAESESANTVQRSNDKGKAKVEADDDEEEEDSVYSLSNSKDTDTGTSSEFEMANTIFRSKTKGKSKEEVIKEESDGKEDSDHSLNSEVKETDTGSESRIPKNKGKKKKEVVESSDSDYAEDFGRLDLDLEEDSTSSDSSYAPDSDEDTATHVKRKVVTKGSQGKSKVIKDVAEVGDTSCAVERVPKTREKVKAIIENPEVYLDDPTNIHFETGVKNRKHELLVKDYCLRFKDYIYYLDPKGKLEAKTAKWKDQRVCIKKWVKICDRNKLKKQDRVVCELLRNKDLVYAVKIHIIRGKHLVSV